MSPTETIQQDQVVIRIAGDSGDGIQITGSQFTETAARIGNDLATFPDYPSEIRAPAGTRPGVSGFQIHFSSSDIHTPGDTPDVLVAFNPAALIVNYNELKPGGIIVVNEGAFTGKDLKKADLADNPLSDGTLAGYRVIKVDMNQRVLDAVADLGLPKKVALRAKNFYALGLMYWLFSRPIEPTLEWLSRKFEGKPELVEANQRALRAGFNAGSIHEVFQGRYKVAPFAGAVRGTYRNIMGNQAMALGLIAGARLAEVEPFLGSYPITPATEILQVMARHKNYGVITMQAEDEIAAIAAAIGASYAGRLGMTTTSGPGLALKSEALGLAVMTELPLVVVNVMRAGPSTGMPTKTEQADLMQSLYGRNSEAHIPVIAAATPSDAFECAIEACRIATRYMTPVIVLSDNYIANGSEPWLLPDVDKLEKFPVSYHTDPGTFSPYSRDEKMVRPWTRPGTPGCEHRIGGLEKEHYTGKVSNDPDNHELMCIMRRDKVMGIRDDIATPGIFGDEDADTLVCGWGSTFGVIRDAQHTLHEEGVKLASMHLRHIFPLPHGLDDIFARFKRVLVPELNCGQMIRILRGEYPQRNFIGFTKLKGRPFTTHEIQSRVRAVEEAGNE